MKKTKPARTHALAALLAAALLAVGAPQVAAAANAAVQVRVDAKAHGTPFPHFWEEMFGSGRASLTLRDDYRKDLAEAKRITGFSYVRFHGILDDDVGLFQLGKAGQPFYNAADKSGGDGQPVYNFSYVDQIYDGLLERGVRPFVELGFMPRDLSSDPKALQDFWYHPNVAPPKDYALWDGMIRAFAQHLVARYGIDEVSQWYFEVWNEPNIGFWAGNPKMETYYTLYDHTARALKSVSPRLCMAACHSGFSLMTSTTWNSSITTGTCPSTAWSSLRDETTALSAIEVTTSHESFVAMSTSMLRTRRSAEPCARSTRLSGSTRPTYEKCTSDPARPAASRMARFAAISSEVSVARDAGIVMGAPWF